MKQLSVLIENRTGTLAEATGILAAQHIDIQAFCLSDTADFGVMHMIVSDTEVAAQALRDGGYVVNVDDVFTVETGDKPGAFHRVLLALADAGVGVEYSYAFVSPRAGQAQFIMKTTNRPAAEQALAALKGTI